MRTEADARRDDPETDAAIARLGKWLATGEYGRTVRVEESATRSRPFYRVTLRLPRGRKKSTWTREHSDLESAILAALEAAWAAK